MPINYVVRKKVDKSKDTVKELYYATTKALQKQPVNSIQIANELAERSSLQNGDALSALIQLSDIIATHLREGRTVSINGLGNFYPTISSEGVEKPEDCTASKVRVARICFKSAPAFLKNVRKTHFVSAQLGYGWSSGVTKRKSNNKKNNESLESEEITAEHRD
ncbi:HU family DNA-binding protein [uncultured Bacteroides sp.]|uniref:HU family DNA-binding protein n=1 Tax=uncultured Bacteroides sp. TaxID=162156 RepID=UPI002AA6E0F4|nr:HU family DNA-binding protein [uncultured Bacteroides sp.]